MKNIKMFSIAGMALLLLSPVSLFAETVDSVFQLPVNPEHQSTVVAPVYNPSCASAAVVTHEDNLQAIREANQASMKTTMITRRDALKSAYLLADESARNIAIKNALSASMEAEKVAMKTMQEAVKKENEAFKSIMKACGVMRNPMNQMEDDNGKMDGKFKLPDGIDTSWIQKMLMSEGVFSGKVDGHFGPKTKDALMKFQKNHNLKPDGKIGPKTFEIFRPFLEEHSDDSGSNDDESDNENH